MDKIPSDYEILTRVTESLAAMVKSFNDEGNPLPQEVEAIAALSILLILAVRDNKTDPECRAREASLN